MLEGMAALTTIPRLNALMQGDFFFDADEMRQGLNQAEHENLDTLVERLQLGSTPANVAQLNSSAVPSDSPLPEVGFENEEEK